MATTEGFVFAGVNWNDFTIFRIQGFDPGVAPKRWQWISGDDADGAVLPEEAHYDNAEMTVRIRIMPQASMDIALAKIGTLIDTLQECEQQPLGSPAVWTPAGSTKSLTAYVLGGEITGIPMELGGDDAGWLLKNPSPVVVMKLYRRPFLYGTEVTSAATVTNTLPYQVLTVASVTGDVPAEARLVVTDGATKDRWHVEWGQQWRYYDAATSLYVDSDNMVTTGFAGAQTTRAGADDPNATGNSVIRATLTTSPVAVCGIGNLGHVGNFRLKLRVYAVPTSSSVASSFKVRLTYKEGDGPLHSNAWVSPTVINGFSEVDLGIVSIPPKTLGTQRWTGQIDAYSAAGGDTIDVDFGLLFPTDTYGKARRTLRVETPTVFSGRDEFDQTAGALAGKTAPTGGIWAGVGTVGTQDLTVDASSHVVSRNADDAALPGRGMTLPLTMTDTITQVDFQQGVAAGDVGFTLHYLLARYVDESNYLTLITSLGSTGNISSQSVRVRIAGVETFLAPVISGGAALGQGAWHTMRLFVDSAGRVAAWWAPRGGALSLLFLTAHSSLATGGALASGKPGFRDHHAAANTVTRYYDNFWAAVPAADAAVFSTRSLEINSEKAQRQDSTGTYYGDVQSYRGGRFFLPPAGGQNRTSRILAKARRNDTDAMADDQIADSTTVTVHYTPRFLAVPR